jgi:hypothetical protein
MIERRLTTGLLAAFSAAALSFGSAAYAADPQPVTVPIILPLTGGGALVGQTHE